MSFGEPNNPYGQPPQGQPGYGYPQAPQGVPQQGAYGYPAAPPASPYGPYPGAPYGAPGMAVMPGTVKTARVLVWIIAILQILGGIAVAALAGTYANSSSSSSDAVTGVVLGLAVFAIALGIWGVVIAAKVANGGNGIRISAIVYGSLVTLGGVANVAQGQNASVAALALGVLIIVFFAKADAAAWFKRPRF
ncbi:MULTISPECIES: hypothetical protein [unclassified Streptomyces]|uniref:hypothetical protein n=1 Tax=unclassified Streptomyces TaxID=2593676 RepID=UPI0004C44DCC